MAYENPPWALNAGSYAAEQTRRAAFAWAARTAANSPGIIAGGLLSASDCQLSAPASGLSVNLSTGEMLIPGNEGGSQGGNYARVTSQTNLPIATANATNPRIDLVCATVNDAQYTAPAGGVTSGQWAPHVMTGTPTSGATLANLSGVAALPGSSLLLGYVLVPANATNIITADILNVASPVAFQGLSGTGVRGAVNIAASQSTSSTSYVTLATPDQVSGIVMPTNGLIAVWYQATWQESVAGAARAAIFIGSNQLAIPELGATGPVSQAAATGASSNVNQNNPLVSSPGGLVSGQASGYTGDLSTGQVVGAFGTGTGGDALAVETNGGVSLMTVASAVTFAAGPCYISAAAGTYAVGVRFKASSGSVTASNRKLWVQALPFG